MHSLMDFDPKYIENYPSNSTPLFFPDNYSKSREEFPLEGDFSSPKSTNFLHDLQPMENFNLNGSSSSSNPIFSHQPPCFETFDNSIFGCVQNLDFYETKPFGNNHASNSGALVPFMDNFSQSGGTVVMGQSHTMTATPINMMSPNAQTYNNPFSYRDFSLTNYRPPDEGSSTTPKIDVNMAGKSLSTTTNMVKRGGRGRGRKKKTNVIKGQWTMEEDRLLIQLVERNGIRKWSQIAQMLNGRIGKQCRERWHNHLRPDIKKDVWSEEEDRILINSHAEIGNKWAEIAKKLPGRTENSIKNHWNATKRRQFSRRKCRTKYPRQSSLLQEYIKSLTPETIYAGCRKKPPIFSNNNNNNPNPTRTIETTAKSTDELTGSSNSSSSFQLCPLGQYDFGEVPDFNFDARMFEDSSIDSLLDDVPDEEENVEAELQENGSFENMNNNNDLTVNDQSSSMVQCEVKKELDLVEMINQVNF